MPDRAPANKDAQGAPFSPSWPGGGADAVLGMAMLFATGE